MLKHDHIALHVRDLAASREFYEYLGGRVVSKPSPHFMEIVLGEIRLHLIPRRDARPERAGASAQLGIDHLCLRVDSFEDLVFMQAKINAYPALSPREPYVIEESPPLMADGRTHSEERPPRKTLYFEDPDGIKLEVRAYD